MSPASPAAPGIAARASSRGPASRSLSITEAPACASCCAIARPIPRPDPVTNATFDLSENIESLPHGWIDRHSVFQRHIRRLRYCITFVQALQHLHAQRIADSGLNRLPFDCLIAL